MFQLSIAYVQQLAAAATRVAVIKTQCRVIALFSFLLLPVSADEIRILAWNLESDRDSQTNDPDVIADWLTSFDNYDIFALSEVKKENASKYIRAIAKDENAFFRYKVGKHNDNDHLMLAWDSKRFAQVGDVVELSHLRFGRGGRAPMYVRLREKPAGPVFTVVVNHLHRSTAWKRRRQAAGLREWVKDRTDPVFCVGDFNCDYDLSTGRGNRSFTYLLQGGHFRWVEPAVKMRTEDSHNSILDLVLVNRKALAWNVRSTILKRNDEFYPAKEKSDHRPVTATFNPTGGAAPVDLRVAAMDRDRSEFAESDGTTEERLARLEEQVDRLADLVASLKHRIEDGGTPPDDPTGNYYSGISDDLSGEDLKAGLHRLIRGHQRFDYRELWDSLSYTDQDPQDPSKVKLLYSGWSYSNDNHGGGVSQWNREHVWAKSKGNFGTRAGAGTDMHHIRPTDVTVNSARGSRSFDNGGQLYQDPDGPTTNRVDDDSWEPRDEVKGDVARMIFYMAVRYEGSHLDLEVVDDIISEQSRSPRIGKLSTLLQWHDTDPPSDFEKRRNQRVYELQGNRNPFIDRPAWARKIWGGTN